MMWQYIWENVTLVFNQKEYQTRFDSLNSCFEASKEKSTKITEQSLGLGQKPS